MAFASTTVRNQLLSDGRRAIVEHHVDAAGEVHRRSYIAPAGIDTAAALTSNAATMAASLKRQELERAFALATSGADPSSMVLQWNTVGGMRRFVLRSMTRLLRDNQFNDVPAAINALAMLDQFTDAQIASVLTNATAAQVGRWRTFLRGLSDSLKNYVPDIGEQSPNG